MAIGGSKRPTSNAGIRSEDPQTGARCVSCSAQGVLHAERKILRLSAEGVLAGVRRT